MKRRESAMFLFIRCTPLRARLSNIFDFTAPLETVGRLYLLYDTTFAKDLRKPRSHASPSVSFPLCFFPFSFPASFFFPFHPGEKYFHGDVSTLTHTHTRTHTRACTREETIGIHQVNIYIHSSPDTVPIKSRTLILSLCPSYIFLLSFFLFFLLSSSPLYLFYTD